MSRSPLAYPLNRAADSDVGGAADLQTDVMRFMAILALCLMAIFALVQSIPLAPEPVPAEPAVEPPTRVRAPVAEAVSPEPEATPSPVTKPAPKPPAQQPVVLTRPEWTPTHVPAKQPDTEGFTLRFASDAALMRAVAAHKVGVYAIEPDRARRMTVSESRITFWDASMPNSFHEMEPGTVPSAVIAALSRTGTEAGGVNWGVTLPGRMTAQLDALMEQHRGGALVIGASGEIHWEAPQ